MICSSTAQQATAAPRFFTAYRLLSKTGTRMAPYTSLPKKVIIVNSFHFKAISTITYIQSRCSEV